MSRLSSVIHTVFSWISNNRKMDRILYLASYVIPIGIFFLILYPINVPTDLLLMVVRIKIFILIIDLPILWALQRTHKQSILFTLLLFAIVFGLALKVVWQNEGDLYLSQATYSTIGGLLPWSDASGYFADASSLLNGGLISSYSAVAGRVLFVSSVSTLLAVTEQNLQLSIALICLACLFSCYFLVREIKVSFGLYPAFVGFILLFAFYLFHAGALLSELLGFALGGIGCAMLLSGTRDKKIYPLWVGIFVITLAVNVRPGAFFIFPALLLWPLIYKDTTFRNKRFWIGSVAMIGAGFLINWLFTQWFAVKISSNYAALPNLILGLVSGSVDPDTLVKLHPELNIYLNNPASLNKSCQMIFATFRSNPAGLFIGIVKTYLNYFGVDGTFSFIPAGSRIISIALDLLYVLGIGTALNSFKNADKNIWGVLGVGVLLTVPIVNYVGVRAYAATIPILVILVSLSVKTIISWFNCNLNTDPSPTTSLTRDELIFTAIILSIVLIGPVIVRLLSQPAVLIPVACPSDQVEVNIRWTQGSYIQLVPDNQMTISSTPRVRITDFRRGMLGYDNQPFSGEMKKIQDNHYLVNAFDLKSRSNFWLILKQDQAPATNGIIGVCGKYSSSTPPGTLRVMRALSVTSKQ